MIENHQLRELVREVGEWQIDDVPQSWIDRTALALKVKRD